MMRQYYRARLTLKQIESHKTEDDNNQKINDHTNDDNDCVFTKIVEGESIRTRVTKELFNLKMKNQIEKGDRIQHDVINLCLCCIRNSRVFLVLKILG